MTNEQFLKLSEILIGVATSLNRLSGVLAVVAEVIHAEKVTPPMPEPGHATKVAAPPSPEDKA